MTDPNTSNIVNAWTKMRQSMRLDGLQFARHAFDAILVGQPKTIVEVAEDLNITSEQAQEFVSFYQRVGLMNLDGDKIVGSLGLTTLETEYHVQFPERKLHVWCALDAVGIPAALGMDADVHVDGLADVTIKAGKLVDVSSEALRISLADPYLGDDMRNEICPNISFHAKQGEPHEGMAWFTVEEAMELGEMIWARPSPENAVTA